MKLRILCILSAALVLPVLVQSCKEKEETKEYLNGSLSVEHDMPSYVQPGDKYTFTPSGVTAPDGTPVGYYFTSPITSRKDTLKNGATSFVYEVPDSLGTFTLSCNAYAVESYDKYYITSSTMSFVVVSDNPNHASITNVPHSDSDSRVYIDGRLYYAGKSGSLTWLRSNLAVVRRNDSGDEVFGRSFRCSKAMQNVFGGYYTWEEAQSACPAGWHLPSDAEWVDLLKSVGAPRDLEPLQTSPSGAGKLMVKARFNGEYMWDYYRDVNITNDALSAIPTGYANVTDGEYVFYGVSDYAMFWTADEYEGKGVYRYIHKEHDNVYVNVADKQSFAVSVRCVR